MVQITIVATKHSTNQFGEALQSKETYQETYYTNMAPSMLGRIMDVTKFKGENLENFTFTVSVKNI